MRKLGVIKTRAVCPVRFLNIKISGNLRRSPRLLSGVTHVTRPLSSARDEPMYTYWTISCFMNKIIVRNCTIWKCMDCKLFQAQARPNTVLRNCHSSLDYPDYPGLRWTFISFVFLTYNWIWFQSHLRCLFTFVCIFHEIRFYCCHDNSLAWIFDF